MINNINNFLAAKVKTDKTVVTGKEYNYLIDLLNAQIRILNATLGSGLSLSAAGILSLGNELVALQALSDAAGFMKKGGDGSYSIDPADYQPLSNELTALSDLADTAGFLKKTGDGAYSIDTTEYQPLGTGGGSGIWGYL